MSHEADAPIHTILRERWSPRAFSTEPVSADEIASLLQAARWAPSAYNEQPWRFLVASSQDPDAHAALASVLVPFNRAWAEQAPLLIVAVAREHFTHNGEPNSYASYDVGQAVAHLTIQATALGLVAHQMAGFDPEAARTLAGIPEGYRPLSVIAVGHLGDADTLPAELATQERAPRQRKPLSALAFSATWGQPA